MTAHCQSCGRAFDYDEESGLNMRHFEPPSDRRGFFLGGVFPCCPSCETRYSPPPVTTEIKWERRWVPIRHKQLPGEGDEEGRAEK